MAKLPEPQGWMDGGAGKWEWTGRWGDGRGLDVGWGGSLCVTSCGNKWLFGIWSAALCSVEHTVDQAGVV